MAQKMFENQGDLSVSSLLGYAIDIGLDDEARFSQELKDHAYEDEVREDLERARSADVGGVPSLVIENSVYTGAQTLEALQEEVDDIIEERGYDE